MKRPFRVTVYVTLDGSGNGTARTGPLSAREIWYPGTVSVSAPNPNGTSPTKEAGCVVSVGDVNTRNFRDACVDGSSGDNTDRCSADVVKCGEYVWAVWTGGDPGAIGTLTVTGDREI